MKKTLLFIVGFLLTYAVQSQDTLAVDGNAKSNAIASRLTRELNLDERQQEQVYSIMQKRWSAGKSTTANRAGDRIAADKKALANLKKVLTPEQYDLFTTLREARSSQRKVFLEQNPDYTFKEDDKDLDF